MKPEPFDWDSVLKSLKLDESVKEVAAFKSGHKAAVQLRGVGSLRGPEA